MYLKDLSPSHLIDKVLNQYITKSNTLSSDGDQVQSSVSAKYFKLSYVGSFPTKAQKRLSKLVKRFCFDLDIKLDFSSFNPFTAKDPHWLALDRVKSTSALSAPTAFKALRSATFTVLLCRKSKRSEPLPTG